MSAPTEMQPPPRFAVRLAFLVGLSIVVVLLVALVLRAREATAEQARLDAERERARATQAAPVEVVHPAEAQAASMVIMTGTLEPEQAADLGFEVPGRVSIVAVRLSQEVHAGDPLVSLDRASVGAQSAQTTATIGVAEANAAMLRDRVTVLEQLVQSGSAATRELTTARQQLAVAEAQVAQAQASRRQIAATSADHTLRAPFDGVVTRVPSGVGVVASPGVPLVRIENLSALRLRTTINESELGLVHEEMPVVLEGSGAQGILRAVVRSLDTTTRRAPVEVHFPNADGSLVANAFVRARAEVGSPRPALRVPASARRADGSVLVMGQGNRIEARMTEAQLDTDGSWLVTDGLTPADRVVVRAASAREGTIAAPIEPASAPSTQAAL